ncbi:MAG: hypothetical protein K0R28_7143 [Paenibacillus sp.]|jgi:hypothetical protein|nr:hypothetical protein [Paenibacillus sp.]
MLALARCREALVRNGSEASRIFRKGERRLAGRVAGIVALAALLPVLSGCMYPKEMRKENQVTATESILVVQNAVDRYKEKNGILPIKNSEMSTPIYEKYVLDMKKLTHGPYLGQVPGTAFEMGGSNLFVLVNPDVKPEVKLLDLTGYQKTGDIQKWVDEYAKANNGAIPKGNPAGQDVFRLDFDKLGKKAAQTESMYSRTYLSYLVSADGTVAIDYAPEIMQAMQRKGMKTADASTDLRTLLVAESPYVPAKSFPYYWLDNEPKPSAR